MIRLDRLLSPEIELADRHGARRSSSEHGGEVPADMDALTKLPGVGRKTANVVLGHALGVPGLAGRSPRAARRRIASASCTSDDPVKVEAQLCAMLPPERWTRASDTLILHGRRICRPKPLCARCNARRTAISIGRGLSSKPSSGRAAKAQAPIEARQERRAPRSRKRR